MAWRRHSKANKLLDAWRKLRKAKKLLDAWRSRCLRAETWIKLQPEAPKPPEPELEAEAEVKREAESLAEAEVRLRSTVKREAEAEVPTRVMQAVTAIDDLERAGGYTVAYTINMDMNNLEHARLRLMDILKYLTEPKLAAIATVDVLHLCSGVTTCVVAAKEDLMKKVLHEIKGLFVTLIRSMMDDFKDRQSFIDKSKEAFGNAAFTHPHNMMAMILLAYDKDPGTVQHRFLSNNYTDKLKRGQARPPRKRFQESSSRNLAPTWPAPPWPPGHCTEAYFQNTYASSFRHAKGTFMAQLWPGTLRAR